MGGSWVLVRCMTSTHVETAESAVYLYFLAMGVRLADARGH